MQFIDFSYLVSYPAHGGVIGAGFCRYDITTALTLNMNDDKTLNWEKPIGLNTLTHSKRSLQNKFRTCFASSLALELAKLIQEQYKASHAKI